MTLYALIEWEDGYSDVIALSRIIEPRKDFAEYSAGDRVTAKWGKKAYEADIIEICDKRADLLGRLTEQATPNVPAEKTPTVRAVDTAGSKKASKPPTGSQRQTVLAQIEECLIASQKEHHPVVAQKTPRQQQGVCVECVRMQKNLEDADEEIKLLKEELDSAGTAVEMLDVVRSQHTKVQEECHKLTEDLTIARTLIASLEAALAEHQQPSVESVVSRPRPGLLSVQEAATYSMVELAPGSGVYLFQEDYHQAINKCSVPSRRPKDTVSTDNGRKDGRPAARFLLNVFFKSEDLACGSAATTTQFNRLNKPILDAIKAFCLMQSESKMSELNRAIACKITGVRSRLKKAVVNMTD